MPDPSPDTVHRIPLAQIDDAALTRDRSGVDDAALTELRLSIAASGLRLPIELFPLPEPNGALRYGLLSGLRRLRAFRALLELTGDARYETIPAFLRPAVAQAQALAAMIEENEIRQSVSPWERGRIALMAWRQDLFPTVEEAIERLYPAADRMKRARLRDVAQVVEEFEHLLTEPEALSLRQCLRLAAALRIGFGPLLRTALEESSMTDAQTQWEMMLPVLTEAERQPSNAPFPRPWDTRPRRLSRPRPGLTIRRERTRDGFCLHFTGPQAKSGMIDEVIEDIERMYSPG